MSDYHLKPKLDRLLRPQKDLHQLGALLTLTTLCADAGMPVRQVPGQYWVLDATAGGEPTAEVSCPCGGAHLLPLMEGPHLFEGCERGYTFDGQSVWVLNSPTPVAVADETTIVLPYGRTP